MRPRRRFRHAAGLYLRRRTCPRPADLCGLPVPGGGRRRPNVTASAPIGEGSASPITHISLTERTERARAEGLARCASTGLRRSPGLTEALGMARLGGGLRGPWYLGKIWDFARVVLDSEPHQRQRASLPVRSVVVAGASTRAAEKVMSNPVWSTIAPLNTRAQRTSASTYPQNLWPRSTPDRHTAPEAKRLVLCDSSMLRPDPIFSVVRTLLAFVSLAPRRLVPRRRRARSRRGGARSMCRACCRR